MSDDSEAVDVAARALFLHDHPGSLAAWEAADDWGKDLWRAKARAVLAALAAQSAAAGGEVRP